MWPMISSEGFLGAANQVPINAWCDGGRRLQCNRLHCANLLCSSPLLYLMAPSLENRPDHQKNVLYHATARITGAEASLLAPWRTLQLDLQDYQGCDRVGHSCGRQTSALPFFTTRNSSAPATARGARTSCASCASTACCEPCRTHTAAEVLISTYFSVQVPREHHEQLMDRLYSSNVTRHAHAWPGAACSLLSNVAAATIRTGKAAASMSAPGQSGRCWQMPSG